MDFILFFTKFVLICGLIFLVISLFAQAICSIKDFIKFSKVKKGDVFIDKHDMNNPFDEEKRYVIVMEKRYGRHRNRYIKYRKMDYDYVTTRKSFDFFNCYKFYGINP